MTQNKDSLLGEALDVIARKLGGRVNHGAKVNGTVEVDDLEIAITMVVTRKVPRAEVARHQREALALLVAEGWRDSCSTTVKNRGYWAVSKTRSCESKVTTAIVYRTHDFVNGAVVQLERYRFCCSHHTEHGPDVIAVVRLPQLELDALRERRNKEAAIRRREEDAKEDRARLEHTLGHPIDDADMVVVTSLAELAQRQIEIARSLLAKKYGDAHLYLRMVMPVASGLRVYDDYLQSLQWRESPPP